MILKKAELKDKKEIMDIASLLYLDIPEFVWSREDFVLNQIQNGEYFLIEDEDKTIGIMSLKQRKNKISIETLAVRKEFQSKGFGTKFIEFAKEFAKENGFDVLHAYSFSEYNMMNFYLKKGFRLLDDYGYYKGHRYYCFEIKL